LARTAAAIALAVAGADRGVAAQDTLRFRIAVRIDDVTEPRAEFGDLRGLAVDGDGTVYAADMDRHQLWAFDADGRLRGVVGREGKGPGEFTWPTAVAVGPDGHLWVRDAERVQRLARDGRTGLLSRYASSFAPSGFADWASEDPPRVDAQSRYLYPGYFQPSRDVPRRYGYIRHTAEGRVLDTVMVPPAPDGRRAWAVVMVSDRSGRRLPGLNAVPFEPFAYWDITPGGEVVMNDLDGYRVRVVDRRGRVVRELTRAVAPPRIPPRLRAESLGALTRRLDSLRALPADKVFGVPDHVRARRLPDTFPAIRGVIAATDGRVWVRRWVAEPARTVFDVWSPVGRLESVVVLPVELADLPTPAVSRDRVAGVVRDPATDLPTIVVLRR
jgi:hypothetical protein